MFFFSEASICVSRKGGTGGGGWVHLKGANSMAISGLSFESTSFTNRLRKLSSHLVGPPFLAVKLFPSLEEWLPAKSCDCCKLVNAWV